MGRMNWGGAQDLSGVFAAMQDRYDSKLEADVANARARAAEEQAAEDREQQDHGAHHTGHGSTAMH